ncbi:hypothetical protein DDW07_02855 [Acidilobus sp. SCGC AC-742_E15]|nr:hypothetical protein DDW07_02855 [Acidilobus sp. SCGC AC-742_E15]
MELGIKEELREAIESAGIENLSDFQIRAFKEIAAGRDVLIIAPTGSGKTEAAVIPVLNEMLSIKDLKGIFFLYITPLKALNRDMLRRLENIARKLGFTVAVRHGDTLMTERKRQSLKPLLKTPHSSIQKPQYLFLHL